LHKYSSMEILLKHVNSRLMINFTLKLFKSFKDFIVAIIVPDEEYLIGYCKKNNINGTFKELCKSEVLKMRLIIEILKYLT
jgi:hypothetical protein